MVFEVGVDCMQGAPITKIEPEIAARLAKQRYHLVGEHGGVKVCHWTKQSLIADRSCYKGCLLYTSPSPRDQRGSRMPSSA